MSKFKTQHINVSVGKDVFGLHRDGKVTWKTKGNDNTAFDEVKHASVADAKKLFALYTG